MFVGAEAYTDAGGTIIRDLFTEDCGGYYDDPALLDRLVREKLESVAADIQTEGWKWVEAYMNFPYAHGLRRVYPEAVGLSEEDEAAYDAAQKEHERLAEELGSVDEYAPEDEVRFMELEAEMARLDGKREAYDPDELARGGVFICLNHDGTARIERGFIRPEDEAPEPEPEEAEGGETVIDGVRVNADGEIIEDGSSPDPDDDSDEEEPEGDAGQPVSDILTRDLTAHRTLGLRLTLGEQPEIALIAVDRRNRDNEHLRRMKSTWNRVDERDYQENVAHLRFQRRGEIDSLTRKLERKEAAIAAFRDRYRLNEDAARWVVSEEMAS